MASSRSFFVIQIKQGKIYDIVACKQAPSNEKVSTGCVDEAVGRGQEVVWSLWLKSPELQEAPIMVHVVIASAGNLLRGDLIGRSPAPDSPSSGLRGNQTCIAIAKRNVVLYSGQIIHSHNITKTYLRSCAPQIYRR